MTTTITFNDTKTYAIYLGDLSLRHVAALARLVEPPKVLRDGQAVTQDERDDRELRGIIRDAMLGMLLG